ncbi:MAG: hypothetical protein GTN53_18105 [Candidatus Aminicenantes bacterium]|nr:hypothetical protein [Candidatus Aminicenantes bacterium]NIQ68368.1 hypothetical protein [Candidatus Aminicenantes bacterium]NIT24411.1 hypothetical protein [Candidatus Aminicenantes bacterium]
MTTTIASDESGFVREFTVEKLKASSCDEIMELFSTLSAPPFSEMNGEYKADLLDQGTVIKNAMSKFLLFNPFLFGHWLCKAFKTEGENHGHGYNSFRKFGKVIRKFRMKTEIVPSRYDGKDVFQLYYPAYSSITGIINMVDEIRKIHDGLYLGIGTWGFTKKQVMIPGPFCLSGPINEFVGSDREEVKGRGK